jgi:hypothetical protein
MDGSKETFPFWINRKKRIRLPLTVAGQRWFLTTFPTLGGHIVLMIPPTFGITSFNDFLVLSPPYVTSVLQTEVMNAISMPGNCGIQSDR